jgi:hypothetical protein
MTTTSRPTMPEDVVGQVQAFLDTLSAEQRTQLEALGRAAVEQVRSASGDVQGYSFPEVSVAPMHLLNRVEDGGSLGQVALSAAYGIAVGIFVTLW